MRILVLSLSFLFFFSGYANSQTEKRFCIEFGYHWTPLETERTGLTRWMIYPGANIAYSLNKKFSIVGSYLYHDINLHASDSSSAANLYEKYSEFPLLSSYEEAVKYEGKMIGIPFFRDYIFIGSKYSILGKGAYHLGLSLEIGHRTCDAILATYIVESPGWPHGFEIIGTGYHGTGFGLKTEISQQLILKKTFVLDGVIGSYFFKRWPKVQPYFGIRLGVKI